MHDGWRLTVISFLLLPPRPLPLIMPRRAAQGSKEGRKRLNSHYSYAYTTQKRNCEQPLSETVFLPCASIRYTFVHRGFIFLGGGGGGGRFIFISRIVFARRPTKCHYLFIFLPPLRPANSTLTPQTRTFWAKCWIRNVCVCLRLSGNPVQRASSPGDIYNNRVGSTLGRNRATLEHMRTCNRGCLCRWSKRLLDQNVKRVTL